jgi:hypothetical protein
LLALSAPLLIHLFFISPKCRPNFKAVTGAEEFDDSPAVIELLQATQP